MPMFVLGPVDLDHPDWEASLHKDWCIVHAPDEDTAREFAKQAFYRGATRASVGEEVKKPTWTDPELVTVRELDAPAEEYTEGAVEVPTDGPEGDFDNIADIRHLRDWVPVYQGEYGPPYGPPGSENQDLEALTDGRLRISGVVAGAPIGSEPLTGGTPQQLDGDTEPARWNEAEWDKAGWADDQDAPLDLAGSAKADESEFAENTHRAVRRVLSNPAYYQVQIVNVLQFLEEMENGRPGANEHPIFGAVENEAELTALLTEMRDELKQMNAHLAVQPDPLPLALATNRFAEVGKELLNCFSSVAVPGVGMLFVGCVGTLLANLGYLDPKALLAILGGSAIGEAVKRGR